VAKQYKALSNFPHSDGAYVRKYVVLHCPTKTASECSIVLFALVDNIYNFFDRRGMSGKNLTVKFLRTLSFIES